jgi:predicted porin
MQKKIIALAVAAAFSAPAFADTNVYGVVDAALVHVSADGQKSGLVAYSGGLATSRLGVKSVEDLNNGMKAVVVLEYALDTQSGAWPGATANTGAIGSARQQMLAVAGDFGTFATGYLQTTGYDWAGKFDPTSGSTVSPLGNVTKGRFLIGSVAEAARLPRALAYISPDMSGLNVAVNYTTAMVGAAGTTAGLGNLALSDTVADINVTAYMLSATYTGVQNLAVGGVYAKTKTPASSGDTTDVALGASYDLAVVKLFATYQTTKSGADGAVSDKAMSFGAVAPVGPGAVAFSYAKNTIGSTVASDNGKGLTLAWLQGLSKTTTFYAAYTKMSQDADTNSYSVINNALGGGSAAQGALAAGNGAMKLGGSSNMIAVGLNKKF